MQKTIYYWEAIIGQETLVSEYSEKLKRLLSGEYKGLSLDLKKIPGYRIYSIRLNDAGRLLFTLLTSSDGKTYLVLLEKIPNHDYQKSRFLKPNVLKQFLETQGEAILKQVQETDFKGIDHLPCAHAHDDDNELSFLKVEYYKDTFIALNEQQTSAVNCYNALPLIISGPPGAGKSCVALNILSQCSEQHAESGKPILLVTRNTYLKNNLATIFAATHPNIDPKWIHIRTYDELLAELIRADQFVGKEDFRQWLKQYIDKNPFSVKKLPSVDAIYNEFGIIDVYETNYLQLGTNESLFANAHERKWLLQAYQEYRYKHLENRINPDFYQVALKSLYACIVADESQNFTPRQLQVLVALANGQNCFCLDTNQATEDVQSKRAFITKLFFKLKIALQEKQLPVAYRCPQQVNRVINALLKTKYRLTGGKVDKQQYGLIELAATQPRQGSVQWWEPDLNSERKRLLGELAGSVNFAIVTLPEFVAEVRAIVDTPLIFTPNQVGGLEYNTIFAYRLFDHEKFKEINKKLAFTAEEDEKETINRPKDKDMAAMLDAPQFNEVFIAFSRACENLIICQADKHEIKHVLAPIRKQISEETGKAIAMPESSSADWEEHRRLQLAAGNVEQAGLIQNKLDDVEDQAEETAQPIMSSSSSSPVQLSADLAPSKSSSSSSALRKKKETQSANKAKKKGKKLQNKSDTLGHGTAPVIKAPGDDEFNMAEEGGILLAVGYLLQKPEQFNENLSTYLKKRTLLTFCLIVRRVIRHDEDWYTFITNFSGYFVNCETEYFEAFLKNTSCQEFMNRDERRKILLFLISTALSEMKMPNGHALVSKYFAVYLRLLKNFYTNDIKLIDFQRVATAAIKLNSAWVLSQSSTQVTKTEKCNTMLHEAVEKGDVWMTDLLSHYHDNIDQLNDRGLSALAIAVTKGQLLIVKILLRSAARPNTPEEPSNPLSLAVFLASRTTTHFEIMKKLLESKMMTLPIPYEILFEAASSSKDGVLSSVIAAGCDVKQLEPEENRNAIFAAIEYGKVDSAYQLFTHGCDFTHADKNGCTPLAIAIVRGNIKAVTIFLPHIKNHLSSKFRLTKLGLSRLCDMNYSREIKDTIYSKYSNEGFVYISALELATELKKEEIVDLLSAPQDHTLQSFVPPAGIGFFSSDKSLEEAAKRDDDSHDYGCRKE